MISKTEDVLEKTDLKTLWSDTLFEMLFDAIENQWSNNALREILKHLKIKGLKPNKILQAIESRYGKESAHKLYERLNRHL